MAFNVGAAISLNVMRGAIVAESHASIYTVKKPHEIENEFSVKKKTNADAILAEAGIDFKDELKALTQSLDMTSISTTQLAELRRKLMDFGLINNDLMVLFGAGNSHFDRMGNSIGRDVKFNAVALFHQRYEEHKELENTTPMYSSKGFKDMGEAIKAANHVLAALTYYSTSLKGGLSLSERA